MRSLPRVTHVQTRRPDQARAAFAQLFGVAPDTAAAHLVTAQMMVRLEQEDLADEELRRAIAKDPRIPQAHYLLGQAAIFRGRFAEARLLLEKELAQNPAHAMALYRLGDAFTREARWDEAIAALQKSIWLQPHFSGPYILLGRSYMKKGQPATAEQGHASEEGRTVLGHDGLPLREGDGPHCAANSPPSAVTQGPTGTQHN